MSNSPSKVVSAVRGVDLAFKRGAQLVQFPDFEIRAGERLAIVGPNGSGKSTLCLAIAGLLGPVRGRIERSGSAKKPSIGYLPQSGGLYPFLTVSENIAFFRHMFGAKETFDPRLQPVLWNLGLGPVLEQQTRALSGGYFRLATLGCTLALGADALILDEPMAGLDDDHRAAAQQAIVESGAALQFLVVTGHRREDVSFCTRSLELVSPSP